MEWEFNNNFLLFFFECFTLEVMNLLHSHIERMVFFEKKECPHTGQVHGWDSSFFDTFFS